MNTKHSNESMSFINKFPEKRRAKVSQYLLALGVDMAKKLGQAPGSNELYQTLSQLAKNIEKSSRGNYYQEQQQQYFHPPEPVQYGWEYEPQYENNNNWDQYNYRPNNPDQFRRKNPPQKDKRNNQQHRQPSPTYNSPYQNKLNNNWGDNHPDHRQPRYDDYDQPHRQQQGHRNQSPFYSDRANRMRSPNKWGESRQHHSDQITAKITESPPPAIYIQSVNTHIDVRRHLDDHQIKELLYDRDDQDTPQKPTHYYGTSPSAPRSIHYSIPINTQNTHSSNGIRVDEGSRMQMSRQVQPQQQQQRYQQQEYSNQQQYQPHQQQAQQQQQHSQQQPNKNRPKRLQRAEKSIDKKGVPMYLKNVQSKIKDQVQHHKMLYQQHREEQSEQKPEFYQEERNEEFDNENINIDEQGPNNPYEEQQRQARDGHRFSEEMY